MSAAVAAARAFLAFQHDPTDLLATEAAGHGGNATDHYKHSFHNELGLDLPTYALVLGMASGLSLPLGAALGIKMSPVDDRICAAMMAFGAGALLFAVTVELYGNALRELHSGHMGMLQLVATITFALLGALFYLFMNRQLEKMFDRDQDLLDQEASIATSDIPTPPTPLLGPRPLLPRDYGSMKTPAPFFVPPTQPPLEGGAEKRPPAEVSPPPSRQNSFAASGLSSDGPSYPSVPESPPPSPAQWNTARQLTASSEPARQLSGPSDPHLQSPSLGPGLPPPLCLGAVGPPSAAPSGAASDCGQSRNATRPQILKQRSLPVNSQGLIKDAILRQHSLTPQHTPRRGRVRGMLKVLTVARSTEEEKKEPAVPSTIAEPREDSKTDFVSAPPSPAVTPRLGCCDAWAPGGSPHENAVVKAKEVAMLKARATASALFLGLLIDGIPEGILMGFLAAEGHLTPVLVISLFVANFPEAFSSASLLVLGEMPVTLIMGMWSFLCLVVGCLTGLSCKLLLAAYPTYASEPELPLSMMFFIAMIEGLTGGAMMACISSVMLPEAFERAGEDGPLLMSSGFLCTCGFLLAVYLKAALG